MSTNFSHFKLPTSTPTMKKKSGEEVRAVRWNVPNTEGSPKLWMEWTEKELLGGLVHPSSYHDLSTLLGSSGCSATKPWWVWSVVGLILMDNGRLTVNPGDWIIEDSVGCVAVYTDEQAQLLLEISPS